MRENVIEFLRDQKQATLTLCQRRFIKKIERLAKTRPEECVIESRNKDGSIVAVVPVAWIKISPSRQLSEEHRQKLAERMRALNADNTGNN